MGNRYEMRLCAVYDAGRSVRPEPFEWVDLPKTQTRYQRSRLETEQLIDRMVKLLDADGPLSAAALAAGLHESKPTIRGILRKQSIFTRVGRQARKKGVPGTTAYVYSVVKESRI